MNEELKTDNQVEVVARALIDYRDNYSHMDNVSNYKDETYDELMGMISVGMEVSSRFKAEVIRYENEKLDENNIEDSSLRLKLCRSLEDYHNRAKDLEIYCDKCRFNNVEEDDDRMLQLYDNIRKSLEIPCKFLETVNDDFIQNIYNEGILGNELLIFAEAFRNL